MKDFFKTRVNAVIKVGETLTGQNYREVLRRT
jgi:hypothetical protein